MVYVNLTGPVEFPTETAGPFEAVDHETKTMTTSLSARTAHEVNTAFTKTPEKILETLCDNADPFPQSSNPPECDPAYTPVDAGAWEDNPWTVEIGSTIPDRLYEHACVIADEASDDAPEWRQSPIDVLLHWGESGRCVSTDPFDAARFAIKAIAARGGCIEEYHEPREWDAVQEDYDEFLWER